MGFWKKILSAQRYINVLKNGYILRNPVELTIFITSKCNFKCHHCFYLKDSQKEKKELTVEEINTLTKTLPKLLRVLITGGEPFLNENIVRICELFYKNTKPLYITIPTNASLPDKIIYHTKDILRKCPKTFINISLSLDETEEARDKITGARNSFNLFKKTHNSLLELKNTYKNLGVTTLTTQTAENEKHLKKILDYAVNNLKTDNFGFSPVRGPVQNSRLKAINPEIYSNITERIIDYAKKNINKNTFFPLRNYFLANRELVYLHTYKTLKENKYQTKCYSGALRLVVNETGEVFPCETLMNNNSFKIGDLRSIGMDFRKLWSSKKRSEILKQIQHQKCFCTHGCDMSTNTFFNFSNIPKLFQKSLNY